MAEKPPLTFTGYLRNLTKHSGALDVYNNFKTEPRTAEASFRQRMIDEITGRLKDLNARHPEHAARYHKIIDAVSRASGRAAVAEVADVGTNSEVSLMENADRRNLGINLVQEHTDGIQALTDMIKTGVYSDVPREQLETLAVAAEDLAAQVRAGLPDPTSPPIQNA